MKIQIEYESETLIPIEIDSAISILNKHIADNKFEPDKMLIDIENFRRNLLKWIDSNRTK